MFSAIYIYSLTFFSVTLLINFASARNWNNCNLQKGDIVFFISEDQASQNAQIDSFGKAVIVSYNSANVFHNAIIYNTTGEISVIHAMKDKGVVHESLEKLFNEENTANNVKLKFFRINEILLGEKAANCANNYLGQAYNDIFSYNQKNSKGESSFYCSQLVEHCFNKVATTPIFYKHKLNFRDAAGNMPEYWVNYYKDRGMEVPEDDIGTHPGSLYETAVAGLTPIICDE
jgi:uncharacterized protein YycO